MSNNLITVIIVLKEKSEYLDNCLKSLGDQSSKNFEVLIISETEIKLGNLFNFNIRIINSKIKKPGKKRHLGSLISRSKYIAFIDDDAYANSEWTYNIEKYLGIYDAITGPAISPEKEGFKFYKDLYTSIYYSKFSGGAQYRYLKRHNIFKTDDFASVNFAIRREIYFQTKGFNCLYWPGEDTYLGNELKKKNIYTYYIPYLLVYHERRESFSAFVKQLFRYSYTRGYFVKKKNSNSLKLKYFLPSLLNLNIILYLITKNFFLKYLLIFYLIVPIISTLEIIYYKKKFYMFLSFFLIIISHIIYGCGFAIGILDKKYK
jgi:glycosyltransferase involved in cell wall biosynthesis